MNAAVYFVQLGFSIVPHAWLPGKIETDCRTCPAFRRCGQDAVMLTLHRPRPACVPLASLHG
jgi:N-acetylglutamate synthase-like GNAT family acetyltransferase